MSNKLSRVPRARGVMIKHDALCVAGSVVHWHTGDLHGYSSYQLLVPDWDTAVFVVVNGPSGPGTAKALLHLSYFVLELLQGHTPWVNVSLACPESKAVSPTPDPYEYDYDYHGDDAQEVNANTQVRIFGSNFPQKTAYRFGKI